MVNYYSTANIDKIKNYIFSKGIKKENIPLDIFRNAVMVCLGMGNTTADRWIRNYITTNIIEVTFDKEKKESYAYFK